MFYNHLLYVNPPSNRHAWGASPPCCYVPHRFLLATYLARCLSRTACVGQPPPLTCMPNAPYGTCTIICFAHPPVMEIAGSFEARAFSPQPDSDLRRVRGEGSQLRLMLCILHFTEGHSLKHSSPPEPHTDTSTKCWGATALEEANQQSVIWSFGQMVLGGMQDIKTKKI